MKMRIVAAICLLGGAAVWAAPAPADMKAGSGGIAAVKGFPIAVWLQDPGNAEKYKAVGINLYVGLWEGPTEAQLTVLARAGMPVLCAQNAEGLKPKWHEEIAGWLQDDEPDNAQSMGKGKGYGPPTTPAAVLERYHAMKAADATRPVMLNLGQGVAWDGWYGRGVRSNMPEDYPEYAKGGDILSFDIYPVTHERKEVAGKLWYVGHGTERLVSWSENKKPVWACIECTHISNAEKKPTPAQVKAEAWLAITHGAGGILYFVHQFAPKFVEAAVLQDAEMSRAITQINREIQELSPAIYGRVPGEPARVVGGNASAIALMTRAVDHTTYVFTVGMSDATVQETMVISGMTGTAEVLGENREITIRDGKWSDAFAGYQVHLYLIKNLAH